MIIVEKPPRNSAGFNGRKLWRRPRPKLVCTAKDRERHEYNRETRYSITNKYKIFPSISLNVLRVIKFAINVTEFKKLRMKQTWSI
jgi:hypothetical protein